MSRGGVTHGDDGGGGRLEQGVRAGGGGPHPEYTRDKERDINRGKGRVGGGGGERWVQQQHQSPTPITVELSGQAGEEGVSTSSAPNPRPPSLPAAAAGYGRQSSGCSPH